MLTQSIPRQMRKLFLALNQFLTRPIDTAAMSALRHSHPPNLHPDPRSVEQLIERIAGLVLERQSLRAEAASAEALEQNRTQLVEAHWELSHALIDRHCPPKAHAAPAAA